jgi:hypothetical protein
MTRTDDDVALDAAVDPLVLALDIGSTATRGGVQDASGRRVDGLQDKVPHAFTVAPDGTSVIDAPVDVADAGHNPLYALNQPPVGVAAVPDEGEAPFWLRGNGAPVHLTRRRNLPLDPPQRRRHGGAGQRHLEGARDHPPQHAVARVAKAQAGASDRDPLGQHLVVHVDIGSIPDDAGVVDRWWRRWRSRRRASVGRWPERPVAVPRRQMTDPPSPQLPPGRIRRAQIVACAATAAAETR